GIVLMLHVDLDLDVVEIVKIKASGLLELNTTASDQTVNGVKIAGGKFLLELSGSLNILEVIRLDASFTVAVGAGDITLGSGVTQAHMHLGAGEWAFGFRADADFFGLATMSASGWVNSRGYFDIALNGELVLGTRSFGLVGDFFFRVFLRED